MKKVKQMLAIIGVVFLLGLYATTFVMALTDNTETMQFFRASLFATFVIPVLMWTYSFIYKLIHKDNDKESPDSTASKKASDK